jgi:thymidine kinase
MANIVKEITDLHPDPLVSSIKPVATFFVDENQFADENQIPHFLGLNHSCSA